MTATASISYQDNHLTLSGDLDFNTVVKLWADSLPLLAQAPAAFSFDLRKVTSANSAGLALLLEWVKYAKQVNKPIQFHHVPAQLVSIATVSGVMSMILR